MKKAFYASICSNGAHGGALYTDKNGVLFRCQKLTVDSTLKNLSFCYEQIEKCEKKRSLVVFPAVTITLSDKSRYKFIIFNRKKFLDEICKQKDNA